MILDLIWYTYCPLLSTEYKYWMEQLHRVENFQETNIGTYLQGCGARTYFKILMTKQDLS